MAVRKPQPQDDGPMVTLSELIADLGGIMYPPPERIIARWGGVDPETVIRIDPLSGERAVSLPLAKKIGENFRRETAETAVRKREYDEYRAVRAAAAAQERQAAAEKARAERKSMSERAVAAAAEERRLRAQRREAPESTHRKNAHQAAGSPLDYESWVKKGRPNG